MFANTDTYNMERFYPFLIRLFSHSPILHICHTAFFPYVTPHSFYHRHVLQLVDEMVTVSTDEICAAIKDGFMDTRCVLEPAGALALAGVKRWAKQTNQRDQANEHTFGPCGTHPILTMRHTLVFPDHLTCIESDRHLFLLLLLLYGQTFVVTASGANLTFFLLFLFVGRLLL